VIHARPCSPIHREATSPRGRANVISVIKGGVVAACLVLHTWAMGASSTTPPSRPAPAGSAYRCTDAGGKVSYSQLPCGPDADTLHVADARSPAQRKQAEQMRIRDAKLARSLRKARMSAAAHAPGPTLLATHRPLPQPEASQARSEAGKSGHRTRKHRTSSPYFTARTPIQPKVPAIPAAKVTTP
jgi:hypothetical protein